MINARGNPIVALIGLLVSLTIFGVMYFTVIKPSTDQANGAIEDARERIKNTPTYVAPANPATEEAPAAKEAPATVPSTDDIDETVNAAQAEADKQVDKAKSQADCMLAAGTDVDKLAACAK